MEIAVVAETEKKQLQTLALDHILTRNVVDDDFSEIRLPGLWTQAREFRACERDQIFILGMLVLERFKHLGVVLVGIFCALASQ